MSRIDAYLAPPDELAAGTRRLDAANQRDNWLRQMELAQMAQMGATSGPSAPAPLPAAQLPRAPMHAPLRAAESHERATPHPAADGMESDEATPAPDARPADGKAGQQAQSDDSPPAAANEAAMTAASQASAMAHAAPAAPSVPAAPAADGRAAASPTAIVAAALPAGVTGAALPAAAPSSLAEGVTTMQAAAQRAQMLLRAASAGAPETADTPEAAEAPAAGGDTPAEAPDWQKRMMHLTGDGDDVKLWIRDGELSPSQSQQLVARLAADVAAMGLRLKEATVNGKPALRAADRAARPDAETNDGAVHPEPITHPTTER